MTTAQQSLARVVSERGHLVMAFRFRHEAGETLNTEEGHPATIIATTDRADFDDQLSLLEKEGVVVVDRLFDRGYYYRVMVD